MRNRFKPPKSEAPIDLGKRFNRVPVTKKQKVDAMLRQEAKNLAEKNKSENEAEATTKHRTAAILGQLRKNRQKVQTAEKIVDDIALLECCGSRL